MTKKPTYHLKLKAHTYKERARKKIEVISLLRCGTTVSILMYICPCIYVCFLCILPKIPPMPLFTSLKCPSGSHLSSGLEESGGPL